MDYALTVASVVIGATLAFLDISNRISDNRRSAWVITLVAGSGAIVLGLLDLRIVGFAVLLYWGAYLVGSLVRKAVVHGRAQEQGASVEETGINRRSWPISGPIGHLGGLGMAATWFTTQLLTVLNPFQMLEMCRQVAGNARLSSRERRRDGDGRGYRTRAVYTLPFAGEWLLANGGHTPKTSHSWDILGQRFALDFVQANDTFERHTGRGTRATEYFCYGHNILASADRTVVRVEDRVRQAFLGWGICDFMARSFGGLHASLVNKSVSDNARRACTSVLHQFDGDRFEEQNLAAHLAQFNVAGRTSIAAAAASFRAKP